MAGWLHGVFVGDWLFVFPLCGISLSLFCNYPMHAIESTPTMADGTHGTVVWDPGCCWACSAFSVYHMELRVPPSRANGANDVTWLMYGCIAE